MTNTKKENLSESNFGHTENEWGTKEKVYCECPTRKDTMKKRKKRIEVENFQVIFKKKLMKLKMKVLKIHFLNF